MLRGVGLHTSEFENLSSKFNAEFVSGGRNTEIEALALTRKRKTLRYRIRAHFWKLPAEADRSRPKPPETNRSPCAAIFRRKKPYAHRIREFKPLHLQEKEKTFVYVPCSQRAPGLRSAAATDARLRTSSRSLHRRVPLARRLMTPARAPPSPPASDPCGAGWMDGDPHKSQKYDCNGRNRK